MKPKEPPQEPDILYQRDMRKLTLENAKQILPPEHLKIFEKMMKRVYAEGFLNGQKSITTAVFVLFFTVLSFGQTYTYSVKLSKTLTTTAIANPTLYKQNIFDLKECKDNTDALAKGLKVGQFYCLPMKDNVSLIAVVIPPIIEIKGTIENQTIYLSKEK